MRTYQHGRHEHGRNYLTDPAVVAALAGLVQQTEGPIVEIGPGRGVLTAALQALNRPLTAVEIDAAAVAELPRTLGPGVDVVHADFLSWQLPLTGHVVVGNIPFHLTTAILRKLLHATGWTRAVLLVQWEVARRRAGVGGASMMTAQWWPWVEFSQHGRIPRHALRPVPAVDGGVLVMNRRARPLLAEADRQEYRQFVHDVFTARGSGIAANLANATGVRAPRAARRWTLEAGLRPGALPRDLAAEQWVSLFAEVRGTAARAGQRSRARR